MKKPADILYVGNMLTRYGNTPTLIESLGPRLSEWYKVRMASDCRTKVGRLLSMLFHLVFHGSRSRLVLVDTYSTDGFYFALLSSIICRMFRVPYITILHGGNLPDRLRSSRRFSDMVFRHARLLVAPSTFMQEQFANAGYGDAVIIPNSIPIEQYPFILRDTCPPALLWLRSFHEIYNPSMAVRLVKALADSGVDVVLHMVGPDRDGSMKTCMQLANTLGVAGRVHMTGFLAREKWVSLSRACGIFINTTNVDNHPASVIEAMALGLPVVSTNAGGVSHLIEDGVSGVLVPPDDVSAMRDAVILLLKQPEMAARVSAQARLAAESFASAAIIPRWRTLIDSIIDRPARVLFLGETDREDARTWIRGLEEFGRYEVVTWELPRPIGILGSVRRTLHFITVVMIMPLRVRWIKPDLILAYRITSYGFLAACSLRKPFVVAQQGITDVYPEHSLGAVFKALMARFTLRRASLIHAWGTAMVPALLSLGADTARLMVMAKGIDLGRFSLPVERRSDGPLRLVTTRSLSADYRHATLLRAIKDVSAQGLDLEMHIVGDGPLAGSLKSQADAEGISHLVVWHGPVDNTTLPEILMSCDSYVSVPVTEGVSTSLFEAMACGCFPIVSDLPANRAWIEHDRSGLLVPVDDASALAGAMLRYAANRDRFAEARSINRRIVEKRASYRENMPKFIHAYQALLT